MFPKCVRHWASEDFASGQAKFSLSGVDTLKDYYQYT